MEVNPDAVIQGLLEEIKRLTLENVALKSVLIEQNHSANTDDGVES